MKKREIQVAAFIAAFFVTLCVQSSVLAAPSVSGVSFASGHIDHSMELSYIAPEDVTPPTTTASLEGTLGSNDWYNSNVTVTLLATDDLSDISETWYSITKFQLDLYTGPFEISNEGTTNLYFYSIDGVGNVESQNLKVVKIDKEPPITGMLPSGQLGANDWFVSDVLVELYASDSWSGVDLTEYSRDNVAWTPYSQPLTIIDEGLISFYYRSSDFSGLVEDVNEAVLKIDKTAPVTTIHLDGTVISPGVYASKVSVSFTAIDGESSVVLTEYSLDGVSWNEYTDEFVIDWEGETTISYRSTDEAGHVEDFKFEIIEIIMGVPETALALGFHYPLDNIIYITSSTTFDFVIVNEGSGDPATYYRINGGEWILYDSTFFIDGDDGVYTVEFYSVDSAGVAEDIQSETFVLTSLEASSFLSRSFYPRSSSKHVTSLDIHFTKKRRCGFKLVSSGHWLWYHVEIKNSWPISVEQMVITPTIPNDFKLSKVIVWEELDSGYIVPRYLLWFGKRCGLDEVRFDKFGLVVVSYDGESIVIDGLPVGKSVFVSFLVEYKLKGAVFKDIEDFTVEEYVFSARVLGSTIISAESFIGLIDETDTAATLEIDNHGVKSKRWRHHNWWKCKCWKFRFRNWKC